MTNRECIELDDYLDGLMTPASRRSFEHHLDRCVACCQAVAFEHALVQAATDSNNDIDIPVALTVRTRDAIEAREWKRRLGRASGVAAALFALCIFAYEIRDLGRELNVIKSDRSSISIGPDSPKSEFQDDQATIVRMLSDDRPRQVAVSLPTENKNVTLVILYPRTTIHAGSKQDKQTIRP